ncbi:MAG: energy transducer TonB [Deltaproteobacteria bacterium]|nr:energy transducer TonB [Deltaproteobacteria bacterium]
MIFRHDALVEIIDIFQKVLNVHSKKILILSLLLSFSCHTAVLSLTTFFHANGKNGAGKSFDVINVDIYDAALIHKKPQKPRLKKKQATLSQPQKQHTITENSPLEDTVNLAAENTKYTPYLKKIKRQIEYRWQYPRQAFEAGMEGITVVKFSINKAGVLIAGNIMSSSGARMLDQGVLDAIQSASPYDPLPDDMNLSKLHVIATFHYQFSK